MSHIIYSEKSMRKIISSIVVLCAILFSANATAETRYGVVAGADITDLRFKQDLIAIEQSVGYMAGVTSEVMFPGIGFGIDLGLQYTQRGATLNLGEQEIWASDGYSKERSYLHYIEIPLHLKFKYTNLAGFEDYVAPFVFGGPSMSILIAHNKIEALEYAGAEFGLTAGIGAELFRNWQLSGSYTWGVTYALKTVKLQDFSAQNRTWKIAVTYFF